jgi:hypothetical protein
MKTIQSTKSTYRFWIPTAHTVISSNKQPMQFYLRTWFRLFLKSISNRYNQPAHAEPFLQKFGFKKYLTFFWKYRGLCVLLEHHVIQVIVLQDWREEFLQHLWLHCTSINTSCK